MKELKDLIVAKIADEWNYPETRKEFCVQVEHDGLVCDAQGEMLVIAYYDPRRESFRVDFNFIRVDDIAVAAKPKNVGDDYEDIPCPFTAKEIAKAAEDYLWEEFNY